MSLIKFSFDIDLIYTQSHQPNHSALLSIENTSNFGIGKARNLPMDTGSSLSMGTYCSIGSNYTWIARC